MTYTEPTDEQLENAADLAADVWAYGSSDDVWEALFSPARSRFHIDGPDTGSYINVAGELMEKIQRTPEFQVGDLNHEQVVAAILRRYPLLGPPPKA